MIRLILGAMLACLVSSCAVSSPGPETVSGGSMPLVSFVFDDGNDTDYLLARKIFAEQGAVASSAVTTDRIGTPYHLTPAQILELQESGWEIMGHTVSHPNLASLTAPQIEEELLRSKTVLENIGVTINNIVYPFNKNNQMVREIAGKYYRSGRGGTNSLNHGISDRYFLKSFTLKHDLPLMLSHIDRAYSEKSWLIFYGHEIDVKVKTSWQDGEFVKGEMLTLSRSGTRARNTTTHWFPLYGSYMYIVPFSGVPLPGDIITGLSSGATARIDDILYDDIAQLKDMIAYIRKKYPDMKIVTIDQGLDLMGVPGMRRKPAQGDSVVQ